MVTGSSVGVLVRSFLVVVTTLVLATLPSPVEAGALANSEVHRSGGVADALDAGQATAERIFASSHAAIWFPTTGRVRWVESPSITVFESLPDDTTLRAFMAGLERDFPGFRTNASEPFLLKFPAVARPVRSPADTFPEAAIVSESFEGGLVNWSLDDNTLGLYSWGTTTCEARTGSYSADALRGGVNSLGCADAYESNVTTSMVQKTCAAVAGASQAWLDTYLHIATETGYDTLGFFYADASGDYFGYTFSGSWGAWFHVVLNLKQWYRAGDVTTTTCPKLLVQFDTDVDTEEGFGARIDDLMVSTGTPSFLACSINASQSSGTAPLTVSLSSSVTGATGSTAYHWAFGDDAGTTATTPTAQFTYSEPGEYRVRLRVENSGVRAYAHKSITVTSGPACTVSCSAIVPSAATAGSSVPFQSTAVPSGCSAAPTYTWNFGDGKTSTQQNTAHAYTAPGTYAWTLTARVGEESCMRSGTITVSSSGTHPRRRPARRPAEGNAPVATATIGASGGTLSGGGFTLTVPPGAFSANANLRLFSGGASTPLDEFRTSKVFELEGLPDDRAKPVSLTLDITRSVSVSGVDFVAVADEVFLPSASVLASPPMLVSATRSGSKVTATIPATPLDQGLASGRGAQEPHQDVQQTFTMWSITGYAALNSGQGHFNVIYPITDLMLGGAEEVANGLESAYTSIADLGFEWNRRTSWPVSVSIEPFDAESTRLGETVPSRWGINWYWLHLNANRLTTQADIALMKEAAAHELFHMAQFLYDPRNRITMARQPGAWLWADEATAVWFENHFNGSSAPPQVVTENHAFMTKRGLEFPPGEPQTVQDHGYGAAQLMRDLANRKGNAAVAEFVRRKSNSQVLPVDAYDTQTGSSAESTWRLFVDEYVRANLYSAFPTSADLWNASSGNRYSFTSSTDSGTTFNWTAPDLSARFYGIQFTDKTWAADTHVTLKLTAPAKDAISTVYTLKSGKITSLGYHYDGEVFKVPNAETFANNGTSLLVVVANGRAVRPYTGTSPITLVAQKESAGNIVCDRGSEPYALRPGWDINACEWENGGAPGPLFKLCLTLRDGKVWARSDTCYSRAQEASGTYDAQGNITFTFAWHDWYNGATQGYTVSGTFTGRLDENCRYTGTATGQARAWNTNESSCPPYDKTMPFTSEMHE
jgi:PKD repeat protein